LDTIAAISKDKRTLPFASVRLREKEIAVLPFAWGLRQNRVIRHIEAAGIRVAALEQPVKIKRPESLPFLTTRGSLLRLAMLPRLLDQNAPGWREQALTINCDGLSGLLTAHILARETRYLRLTGEQAAAVKRLFFREYGFLTDSAEQALALGELNQPAELIAGPHTLPLPLAEALLLTISRQAPSVSPAYLFRLARLAAYYGFELPPSAAAKPSRK